MNPLTHLNLSLQELLSVLLPGAVGLYFLNNISFVETWMNSIWNCKPDWQQGLIFFVAAYFLGYLIYVASSFLDGWYNCIKRKALKLEQQKELKMFQEEDEVIKNMGWIYKKMFPHLKDTHNLIVKVVDFKNRDIGKDLDGDKHQIIDAYQYAFRRLMAEQETMFVEVERYYGTARFFRGITVVLFSGMVIWIIGGHSWKQSLGLFILTIISLLIFLNRWRKANHVAFKNIIILEGNRQRDKSERIKK